MSPTAFEETWKHTAQVRLKKKKIEDRHRTHEGDLQPRTILVVNMTFVVMHITYNSKAKAKESNSTM